MTDSTKKQTNRYDEVDKIILYKYSSMKSQDGKETIISRGYESTTKEELPSQPTQAASTSSQSSPKPATTTPDTLWHKQKEKRLQRNKENKTD
ncbi:hypothetical protein PPL_07953 [Heterostelium album PN500]|uniref:Uncharacterized protein n=1 Tax=Heterostelium pallidum (strain ATCC 26659 / Pp 5 / PN500) TaxID=670386 RepID=D3BHF1_HETP5|nr:hypothetical protein PPL_07953 [Heterostelium album PN500]EFA79128.1 hypothetical protein PPL_07953 [Heterostelium album PN500]|eukprot:XP_020431250.1 hypothetical protein PPL_07953 [Heterostelium album PN500]